MKIKTRDVYFLAAAALAVSLYLLVPACGNKSSNVAAQPYPPGAYPVCMPGQICQGNLTGQGIPLLNGPSFSSIDSMGSTLTLNYAAPNVIAGQVYNGPVNMIGVIHLAVGCSSLPPGDYQVQGQGMWAGGYGGAIAGIQGQLQMAGPMGGGMVNLYASTVNAGPDPLNPMPSPAGYYVHGVMDISGCRNGIPVL